MHDLPKVRNNYSPDFPKDIKVAVIDNLNFLNVSKMTKVPCSKSVKVTSNFLDFETLTQQLNFTTEKTIIKASIMTSSPKKTYPYYCAHLPTYLRNFL